MNIKTLQPHQRSAWNDAVAALPQATFFHLAEWQDVIAGSYRFAPHYLYAEDCTGICGILPLYRVSTPLFGSSLMSVPLGVYGGAASHCPSINRLLENKALELARQLKVGHLELRNHSESRADWPIHQRYCGFKKPLITGEQANLLAIPQKQRAEVRKAIKAGLSITANQNAEHFFKLYAHSVHRLGTPVYPRRLFQLLMAVFPEQCDIYTVFKGDQPLSAVLNFYFKDTVLPYYGGGFGAARHYSAFAFMYWQLMSQAAERGYQTFDFGRSISGSGAAAFKKNFGFTAQALPYQYQLVSAKALSGADPDNSLHQSLSRLWQRLPLALANRLGPLVSRVTV